MIVYPVHASKLTIGGKAEGLLRLKRAGVAVPDFLVLPAEHFDAITAGHKTDGQAARDSLSSHQPENRDRQTLEGVLSKWDFPRTPVVVRSSISDEDGGRHAFAGLMRSFVNVTDIASVYSSIAACAASAYAPAAMDYRRHKGLSLHPRPAVIIQQFIDADASGVIFSTFPEYPQEMAIHAVWGLGEGLVSGQLQPDEFYLLKKDGRLNRTNIADKQQKIGTGPKGMVVQETEAEKSGRACLSAAQLAALYATATKVEEALGCPQDMEFAVKGDRIWMVQSRPITQPIPEVVVYDNSNIQESYCGVTTPLTFSFARRAYATVYRQTMKVLGLNGRVVQAHDGVVNNLLGLVKGRIYYNINNWYKGLLLLPSFKQNKEDMERMMGVQEPVDFVEGTRKTALEKIRMLPSLALNLVRLLRAFRRLPKAIPAFHLHFSHQYKRFYSLALDRLAGTELIAQKDILDQELLGNWTTPIINDFYVMMANGKVDRKLRKAGITDVQGFLSRYLSGDQQIASMQPAMALQQLAEKARADPELQQLIRQYGAHAAIKRLYPDFYAEVTKFIDAYGDRTVGELKLETATMRTDPAVFYKYLANFLQAAATPLLTAKRALKEEAARELDEKLSTHSARLRTSVYGSLEKLQKAIRYREALRLERTRLFGMYRSLYLALGRRFCAGSILHHPEAVFYLTEAEIRDLVFNPKGDLAALTDERKKEFERYRQEDVPARLVVPSPPAAPAESGSNGPHALNGTGCYPGIVEAQAMVVSRPEDDLHVAGKIICALRTDPGWVSLFPTCKGVLIEKGSALSHSVILLREFGIPTIINIPALTKRIRSGQRITMNGTTGEIHITYEQDRADTI